MKISTKQIYYSNRRKDALEKPSTDLPTACHCATQLFIDEFHWDYDLLEINQYSLALWFMNQCLGKRNYNV